MKLCVPFSEVLPHLGYLISTLNLCYMNHVPSSENHLNSKFTFYSPCPPQQTVFYEPLTHLQVERTGRVLLGELKWLALGMLVAQLRTPVLMCSDLFVLFILRFSHTVSQRGTVPWPTSINLNCLNFKVFFLASFKVKIILQNEWMDIFH